MSVVRELSGLQGALNAGRVRSLEGDQKFDTDPVSRTIRRISRSHCNLTTPKVGEDSLSPRDRDVPI